MTCLQNFAEAIEQMAACDAIFAGSSRAAPLTPRQKQQALVAFLRSVLGLFQLPARRMDFEQPMYDGLIAAVRKRKVAGQQDGNLSRWGRVR